jgi:hypothetical protein
MCVCVCETGPGNVSGCKRPMEPQTPKTAFKFPRTVDQTLVPSASSTALPTPGFQHTDKSMSKIFGELMQLPHNGLVPSTCTKQVKTALEKIIFCYHVRVCIYTYIHTYIHIYIYVYIYIQGIATKEELKLLLDNNRDNKGRRQLLLKNLDNVVAKHFESLYKNSGDGKVVVSVTKWLKDGVRELSFLSIVVRAPLMLFVLP